MAAKKKSTRTKTAGARTASSTHDDFYRRLRERVEGWTRSSSINPKYRDYVLALPDLFHLVVRLAMDKRVDATSKAVLGAAIAWAIVPFDILPDVLGPLGMLDDLLILVLALDFLLDRTPRSVVQEHWAGSGDVFTIIRNVIDRADEWMGRGLYQKIRSMMTRGMTSKAAATARGGGEKAAPARGARKKTSSRKKTAAAAAPRPASPRKRATKKKTTKARG